MHCPMSLKGIGIQLLNVDHLDHRAPTTHKQMKDCTSQQSENKAEQQEQTIAVDTRRESQI